MSEQSQLYLAEAIKRGIKIPLPVAQIERLKTGQLAAESLEAFSRRKHPDWDWDARHIQYLLPKLQQVIDTPNARLIINWPPRHSKTELATIRLIACYLKAHPAEHVILGAYNATMAAKIARKVRRILDGEVVFASDRNTATEFELAAGGGLRAVGVGQGIAGYGASLIVIDDPIKNRQEADSLTYRERTWEWLTDDIATRQHTGCRIVLNHTRWHIDDPTGRLLKEQANGGEVWQHICLPGLAKADDPLGRKVGEALWPARFPESYLQQQQRRNSFGFASLYQQEPMPEESIVFRREWFSQIEDVYPDRLEWIRYWDIAASEKADAAYTASIAVAFDPQNGCLWLRDGIRVKNWLDAREVVLDTFRKEPGTTHLVEVDGLGLVAYQSLMTDARALAATVYPRSAKGQGDKLQRALPWARRAQQGRIRLVAGNWIQAFMDEIAGFPQGDFKDQVDSVSGAIAWLAISSDEVV